MFLHVSVILFTGRDYPSMHWGRHPPWADTSPIGRPPTGSVGRPPTGQTPSLARHTPWADTSPPAARYASYWNAILFHLILLFKNLGINNGTSKQNSEKFNDFNNNSGVRSVAVRRFKFTESLIVNQMVQTLYTSANILHVCKHKNMLTML